MSNLTVKITGNVPEEDLVKSVRELVKMMKGWPFDKTVSVVFNYNGLSASISCYQNDQEAFKDAIRDACGKVMYDDGESDFLDCYKNLKEYSKTHASWMATAANIPVWEGAESMSVEQMLTFIEDDVREKGFNPDDFNL